MRLRIFKKSMGGFQSKHSLGHFPYFNERSINQGDNFPNLPRAIYWYETVMWSSY